MSKTTGFEPLTADRGGSTSQPPGPLEIKEIDLDRLAAELYRLMAAELLQERERGAGRGAQER